MAFFVSQKFLDTDGFWKFSVSFPSGKGEAIHIFYYPDSASADSKLSKALSAVQSITESQLMALKLENNVV